LLAGMPGLPCGYPGRYSGQKYFRCFVRPASENAVSRGEMILQLLFRNLLRFILAFPHLTNTAQREGSKVLAQMAVAVQIPIIPVAHHFLGAHHSIGQGPGCPVFVPYEKPFAVEQGFHNGTENISIDLPCAGLEESDLASHT